MSFLRLLYEAVTAGHQGEAGTHQGRGEVVELWTVKQVKQREAVRSEGAGECRGRDCRGCGTWQAHPSPPGAGQGAWAIGEPAGQGHPPDSQQKLGQPTLPTYLHSPPPCWGNATPCSPTQAPLTPSPCH